MSFLSTVCLFQKLLLHVGLVTAVYANNLYNNGLFSPTDRTIRPTNNCALYYSFSNHNLRSGFFVFVINIINVYNWWQWLKCSGKSFFSQLIICKSLWPIFNGITTSLYRSVACMYCSTTAVVTQGCALTDSMSTQTKKITFCSLILLEEREITVCSRSHDLHYYCLYLHDQTSHSELCPQLSNSLGFKAFQRVST